MGFSSHGSVFTTRICKFFFCKHGSFHVPNNTTRRVRGADGQRSAACGWTAGKISSLEPAWHGAHNAARGVPGRGACWACRPHRFSRGSSSEMRFSAWAFRRGGGAAAGCVALLPPQPCPCWQSVVAAPLSASLPRIPGPLDKLSSTVLNFPFFSLGFPPRRERRRGWRGAPPTALLPLLAISRHRAAERFTRANVAPLSSPPARKTTKRDASDLDASFYSVNSP